MSRALSGWRARTQPWVSFDFGRCVLRAGRRQYAHEQASQTHVLARSLTSSFCFRYVFAFAERNVSSGACGRAGGPRVATGRHVSCTRSCAASAMCSPGTSSWQGLSLTRIAHFGRLLTCSLDPLGLSVSHIMVSTAHSSSDCGCFSVALEWGIRCCTGARG